MIDYALIWAFIMAFAVFAYVILDGFDLGIGILFPLMNKKDKGTAMNSIAPFWDGNETWLVLGGGGLYATFPLAYSIIFSALYAPLIMMLLALIFRGVSFEFRWRAENDTTRKMWDYSFTIGSFLTTFSQGIVLGALVQGIDVLDRSYAGGWWDWLTPFSLTTGFALVIAYTLMGACWLILKTDGHVQKFAYAIAKKMTFGLFIMIGLVSLWMAFSEPEYLNRWFSYPNWLYLSPIPLLVLLFSYKLYQSINHRKELSPLIYTIVLFLLSYFGLCISFYPYIVPNSITLWQAASPDSSLKFLLYGSIVLIPVILAYSAYSYWVFRGKVREDENYH